MTDAEKLLSALWRSKTGCYQLADGRTFKPIFIDPNLNIQLEVSKIANMGLDVYFACAEYRTNTTRRADNVTGAYAFWLDIDCGAEKSEVGKGYASEKDALSALIDFCKQIRLPEPSHVVQSGGGIHVYWVLTEFVSKDVWQAHAQKLKALTHKFKLLADDSRTADIASLLRVPGTFNYKYNPPKAVRLRKADGLIATSDFFAKLDQAYQMHCMTAQKQKSTSVSSLPETPANLKKIKSALASIDPDCDWKVWFEVLCALRSLNWSSSEALAKSWSKGEIR